MATINFTDLYGGASAPPRVTLSINCHASRTFVAPQNGILHIRAVGAGGGGAGGNASTGCTTGGYSGAWGVKMVRVKKDDVVTVSIGAGGSGGMKDGASGGATTVSVGGNTYTAAGGPGGRHQSVSAPGPGPSPGGNWDFGQASSTPEWAAGTKATAGASVNLLSNGGGRDFFPAPAVITADWGVEFDYVNSPFGKGGAIGGSGGKGAGGGAHVNESNSNQGGARGGNGYAHLKFFADTDL